MRTLICQCIPRHHFFGYWRNVTQSKIEFPELAAAVERALVRLYDQEFLQYNEAKRFKWLTLAFVALTAILAVFNTYWFKATGVLSLMAGLGWLIGHMCWKSLNEQIGELVGSLGESGIYVGGEGRDVRLTTNSYDTPFGIVIGKWLRSPIPRSHVESADK